MEPEGLSRSLKFLLDQGLQIKTLITDRHRTIQSERRKNFPDIEHLYDAWHIAKGEWIHFVSIYMHKQHLLTDAREKISQYGLSRQMAYPDMFNK